MQGGSYLMGRVVVYHGSYGCDTGCCGHYIELDGVELPGSFTFHHPWQEDHLAFVKDLMEDEFGKGHCHDLDWENCIISED